MTFYLGVAHDELYSLNIQLGKEEEEEKTANLTIFEILKPKWTLFAGQHFRIYNTD
jgi:hypothetical protein